MRSRAGDRRSVTPSISPVCTMLPGPARTAPLSSRWSSCEVGPAVVAPEDAVGGLGRRRGRETSAARRSSASDATRAVRGVRPVSSHPAVGQRRVVDGVQPVAAAVERLEPHPDDRRRGPGRSRRLVSRYFRTSRCRPAVKRRLRSSGRVGDSVVSVGHPVGERLAVGHHELEAAHAGRGQVGVEDLADPACCIVNHTLLRGCGPCRTLSCRPRSMCSWRRGRGPRAPWCPHPRPVVGPASPRPGRGRSDR